MNRLLKFGPGAIAAALLIASLAVAADEQPAAKEKPADAKPAAPKEAAPADISGAWDIHISFPGRPPQDSVLKLEKAGDKYVGVMSSNQGRPNPVKDVQYKDGELSFKVTFERQGQKAELKYTAQVTGDTLKGKLTITGRNFSIDLAGKRAKPESPAVGVWKIIFVLESGQKLQPSIQIKQVGDRLSGDYVGISGKKVRIREVNFKDGELSFTAADHGEEDIVFHYAGKVSGDSFKGTVSWSAAGNQKQSLKCEAQKSRVLTAEVGGTWQLKVAMKDGPTFEPKLTLTQTGGGVTGTYTGEQGETPVADGLVLGDEFTFEVSRQKDGKTFKLRYQGKVNGDVLKGSVDYNFDGITGAYEYEGKRIAPGTTAKP
jgi:hypothetical protein